MNPTIRRIAVAAGAAALSAALFYFGTGMRPVPWLTWLAPLPVLLLAPRAGRRTAFLSASAAWLGGEAWLWGYLLHTVGVPAPMAIGMVAGSALGFGLVALAFRALVLRRYLVLAAAVVPAAWVVLEYLTSVFSPNGAWWSLAYTQAGVLPVLQTVSLTGPWGVTFLVLGAPAALAAFLAPGAVRRVPVAVTGLVVLALATGYGSFRLRGSDGARTEKVALLATDDRSDPVPVTTADGRALLARYAARIPGLAARGARVVVMPEKAFVADDVSLSVMAATLGRVAAARHVDVIAGLVLDPDGVTRNAAVDFPAGGGRPVLYFKHHLVPGLEDAFRPGDAEAFVPGSGRAEAIAICFDLDLPGLVRGYRRAGASALFVPAWDFDRDAWLHSRMAVTRGVENGLTMARSARNGALTVSDPHGRVLAEARSADGPMVSVLAPLPSRSASTVYTRYGDWFAWACALLLLLGGAAALRTRLARRAGGEGLPVAVEAKLGDQQRQAHHQGGQPRHVRPDQTV